MDAVVGATFAKWWFASYLIPAFPASPIGSIPKRDALVARAPPLRTQTPPCSTGLNT